MNYLTNSGKDVSSEWDDYLKDEIFLLKTSENKIKYRSVPQVFADGVCINPPRVDDFELITSSDLVETGYTWGNWLHDWCNTVFCALPSTKYHIK